MKEVFFLKYGKKKKKTSQQEVHCSQNIYTHNRVFSLVRVYLLIYRNWTCEPFYTFLDTI